MTPDEHDRLLLECEVLAGTMERDPIGMYGRQAAFIFPRLWAAYTALLNAESWMVDRTCCARMLSGQYAETVRAEKAEAELARVYERIRVVWESSVVALKAGDEEGGQDA